MKTDVLTEVYIKNEVENMRALLVQKEGMLKLQEIRENYIDLTRRHSSSQEEVIESLEDIRKPL